MSYLIIGADYTSLPYVIDFDGSEEGALKRVEQEEKNPERAGFRPMFLVDFDAKTVMRILRAGSDSPDEWRLADEARTVVGINTPDEYFTEISQ